MTHSSSSTKLLFESLVKLYKQGQLLLLDSDKKMGERGWTPMTSVVLSGLSYSLNNPDRWYLRWANRFYSPEIDDDESASIERIPFTSIHFASDHDNDVDEPLVVAGWILFGKALTEKEAAKSWDYWMCKYWFSGKPHPDIDGWRQTGQSNRAKNVSGSETFAVPLYDITSGDKLEELVITPLLNHYPEPHSREA